MGKDQELSLEQEDKIMDALNKESYQNLLDDYFKIFFVKVKILDSIKQDKFQIENFNFTKKQISNALVAENPFQALGIDKNKVPEEFTASKLKMALFMSTIQDQLTSNPIFLLKEYKDGNIYVYKETIMFKALKYIPVSMVKSIISKAKDKIKLGGENGNI
jgi:hypothetical protein